MKEGIFDIPWAQDFASVRQAFLGQFLSDVRQQTDLASAVDIGCGVGYFCEFLSQMGFNALGVDGREDNVEEARIRYPDITFLARNAEDVKLPEIGTFDFVLCVGLLYHLENPFRVVRNLHSLTDKVLLIEGMCLPGAEPAMIFLDEGVSENQGLNYVAFYPSESCLIMMLYRAGFPFVYRFKALPSDPLYKGNMWQKRLRTLLVASKLPLRVPNLIFAENTFHWVGHFRPWATRLALLRDALPATIHKCFKISLRVARFIRRPWAEKREILDWYFKKLRNRISES